MPSKPHEPSFLCEPNSVEVVTDQDALLLALKRINLVPVAKLSSNIASQLLVEAHRGACRLESELRAGSSSIKKVP